MRTLRAIYVLLCFGIELVNGATVATTNPLPAHIVTLHAGTDLDALVQEFDLHPTCIYRHALNGFSAPMDAATIQKLATDQRVLAVEPNGKFELCSQTVPTGIVRMGMTNFPVAHINGQDHRINLDVAVLDRPAFEGRARRSARAVSK